MRPAAQIQSGILRQVNLYLWRESVLEEISSHVEDRHECDQDCANQVQPTKTYRSEEECRDQKTSPPDKLGIGRRNLKARAASRARKRSRRRDCCTLERSAAFDALE
jgi:hypothetical protein